MSLADIRQGFLRLQEALAALEAETCKNTEVRLRAVSVKAKNLNPGDTIQWPYHDERVEVYGWGMVDGHVTVARSSGSLATFNAEERVRVYRG